jgi:hypothetical protein
MERGLHAEPAIPFYSNSDSFYLMAESLVSAVLIAKSAVYRSSRSNQVCQSLEAE